MDLSVPKHLAALDAELAAVPGTVSVWCGRPAAPPAYARLADATHYAASTMKVAVLAAAYRRADAGTLDLDAEVPVHAEFDSAAGDGSRFAMQHGYDNDDQVWDRLGGTAPLRWLLRRMVVRSSNLATNLVLERVGTGPVGEAWRAAGATHSTTGRGIEDYAAARAGRDNLVTAADLARLLGAIATERLASPAACREMLDVLLAQEFAEDLAAGLPPGTRIAHKNGWVDTIRHGVGVVYPDDAPPYAIAVCTTGPLPPEDACRLVATISTAAWNDRDRL